MKIIYNHPVFCHMTKCRRANPPSGRFRLTSLRLWIKINTGYDTVKAILQLTVGVKVNTHTHTHTFMINQLCTGHPHSQDTQFHWKDA